MFFFDCEQGYVADNGQNDVTDGSVENYDFNWDEETVSDDAVNNNIMDSSTGTTADTSNEAEPRPTDDTQNMVTDGLAAENIQPDAASRTPADTDGSMAGETTNVPLGNAINNSTTGAPLTRPAGDATSNTLNGFPGTPSGNVVIGTQLP